MLIHKLDFNMIIKKLLFDTKRRYGLTYSLFNSHFSISSGIFIIIMIILEPINLYISQHRIIAIMLGLLCQPLHWLNSIRNNLTKFFYILRSAILLFSDALGLGLDK